MVRAALVLMFLLVAAPAFAQAYVSGAVGLDVFRPGRVEARGAGDVTTGGEAVMFSLRVGTAMTDRWGVELGVTRPETIEREIQRGFPVPLLTGQPVTVIAGASGAAIPVFDSTLRVERRNTTIDAAAWVAQTVSSRVDLVYLGGVAFNRVVEEVEFGFSRRIALPLILPTSTRTTSYGVGPLVGLDARLRLTEHVMLVPGMRLQGVGGNAASGWIFRSSVGLGWQF